LIDLASECRRTSDARQYSKLDAAQHQLEAAIAKLFLGNWPAAITLAGAAEDVLPPKSDKADLFSVAKTLGEARHGKTPKEIADLLNETRNWLKHDQQNTTSPIQDITQEDAVIMVLRAATRFGAHHAPLEPEEALCEALVVFRQWFTTQYRDWLVTEPAKDKS